MSSRTWRRAFLGIVTAALLTTSSVLHSQTFAVVLLLHSPEQIVQIPDDRGRLRERRFDANARVFEDGLARGGAVLERGGTRYEFGFRRGEYDAETGFLTLHGEGVEVKGNRNRGFRAYVERYQESASAVVAEERYLQEYWRRRFPHPAPLHVTRRELRSEMGFTFFADAGLWFGFRDVLEVDGARVPKREQEFRQLFLDRRVPSGEQFKRVAEASARFNIGPGQRNFNVPMMTLLFASPEHFERCRFEVLQVERLEGVETAVIAFTETARPTLITRNGHDRPSRGLLWVETDSGRIRRTELSVREDELDAQLTWRDALSSQSSAVVRPVGHLRARRAL